ncbi:MAG: hypothetical protein A2X76_01290 [Lysobacterales bacterium GWF1_69_6]|nr:MAG: hypothetical protein A2X76_01290 [Xanthomonadales bacterium GWF1_69_6]HBU29875.1 hypothetical protein [Thiobacillus sp.]
MNGLSIAAALILVYLLLLANWAEDAQAQQTEVRINLTSEHIRAYGNFVRDYARAHPSASAQITNNAVLNLPAWYTPRSDIAGGVLNGQAFAYFVPVGDAEGFAIARAGGPGARAGLKVSGVLRLPGSGVSAGALPSYIPNGAVVYVFN